MDFQEFRFQDNRRKVDCQLIEAVNSQRMENATNELVHRERDSLKSEPVCDLRKSLAWDSAFFNSPGVLDPDELFETLNFQLEGADISGRREPMSLPSGSTEPARTSGISCLRKSLAWDSAFFTSAGVLDAEELSVINKGFKSPETVLLPRVEEEIWRSAESNSTVNSDCYSLASLENDLFDDIRASIRKSRDASSNVPSSSCKLKRIKGSQNGHVSRAFGALSASQVKHATSSGGSNPSSSRKPPRVSSRTNPSPTLPSKRTSLSASHADNKATKTVDGKNTGMSKKMCLRESCNIISSSMTSAKSSSSVFPAEMRLCYASADFTGKSTPDHLRRATDSRLTASSSGFQTPLKYSVRQKSELVNSSDSIHLISTPKTSIYTSPSSSIDGWSSKASSAAIRQRSNSSAVSPVNTPFREIFDRDTFKATYSERHQYSKPYLGHEIGGSKFMNPQNNDISMCSSPAPANVLRKLKPSGLRMPSPKMGYFDMENSTGLAQNGGLKFQAGGQTTSSKARNGVSKANLSANRTRNDKHRLAGSMTVPVSKAGMKDEAKICSREKQQSLKEQRVIKSHRLAEHNKENIVSFENQVDHLSRRMGAIGFSRDLPAGF